MLRRLFYILLIFTGFAAKAQEAPAPVNNLKTLVASLNDFRNKLPVEKLYLQLDKPYYTLGDTLRFKSYLLEADFLTPSTRSGMLYVEMDDAAGKMTKRIMVALASGISWGDIALDEKEFPEGSYTLRAYTNWMRNFGEDHIFKKNIYLSATNGASTLVKADFKLSAKGAKSNIQANLRFTGLDKSVLRLKDMQLWVMNGKRTLIRDKTTTGMDGSMDVNFDLADKTLMNNLVIKFSKQAKGQIHQRSVSQ